MGDIQDIVFVSLTLGDPLLPGWVICGDILSPARFEGYVLIHRVVAHFIFNREIHPTECAGKPVIARAKRKQRAESIGLELLAALEAGTRVLENSKLMWTNQVFYAAFFSAK